MATKETVDKFIKLIAKDIVKECIRHDYQYPSAIIAQALHESSFGASPLVLYNNFWGITAGPSWKGETVRFNTWEDKNKNGKKDPGEEKKATPWRVYQYVRDGVTDYFKIITTLDRYFNLKTADSPEVYLKRIDVDGWATDGKYSEKIISGVLNKYELRKYDVALQVIKGRYGNGSKRVKSLTDAGYNYREIQDVVNYVLK